MAKYIGTYATSGDVQTALDNSELSRPFIAYTTDNDKVYYGPAADRAVPGDIVVYSVSDDLLHYIKQADYNTTSYPSASYVPVGVVAYPQADDMFSGPSGEITFMGLNFLDKNNPDTGNTGSSYFTTIFMRPEVDVPELTNYATSGAAITDMNGKENTDIYLAYATGQTDWRTSKTIADNIDGVVPVCELAWRYITSGTIQGDWYVPAAGQIYKSVMSYFEQINAGLSLTNGNIIVPRNMNMWSSTECNETTMWCMYDSTTSLRTQSKTTNHYRNARPFCTKLMTCI